MSELVDEQLAVVVALAVHEKTWVPPKSKNIFFSKYDLWMYDATLDNKLCPDCLENERNPRYFGNELRTKFPYLTYLNDDTFGGPEPNGDGLVHPNCRCRLRRVTKWSEDDIKWFLDYAGEQK